MVRIKQRYLLLNILYPTQAATVRDLISQAIIHQAPTPEYLDAGRFIGHLRQHIVLLFGDLGVGLSAASLKIVYFSNATSTAILRVPRNHHRLVWAALTYINELPAPSRGEAGKPCVVRVLRVSGTIRKAEEELIRRTRRDIVKAKLAESGNSDTWLTGTFSAEDEKKKSALRTTDLITMAEDSDGAQDDESD